MALQHIETTISGWALNDPEVRRVGEDSLVTTVKVIHTPRFQTSDGWRDGRSMVVKVQTWGAMGENVQASVRKGNPIVASGRLDVREWNGKNGKGVDVTLRASSMGIDLSLARCVAYRPTKRESLFNVDLYLEAVGTQKTPVVVFEKDIMVATPFVSADELKALTVVTPDGTAELPKTLMKTPGRFVRVGSKNASQAEESVDSANSSGGGAGAGVGAGAGAGAGADAGAGNAGAGESEAADFVLDPETGMVVDADGVVHALDDDAQQAMQELIDYGSEQAQKAA